LIKKRELDKLHKSLGGIRNLGKTPSALWVVDTKKEHLAIDEAQKLGIPVIAILDTNCDPDEVQYPIPGNDDAIRSVGLLTRIVADAAAEGLIQRHQKPEEGEEGAEPLAEWERELLEAGDGVQSNAETAKVVDADLAEGKAEAASIVDEEAEQIEATESDADAEGAAEEAAAVVEAEEAVEGDAAEVK
jgi:small subunit ribosomal protein S2